MVSLLLVVMSVLPVFGQGQFSLPGRDSDKIKFQLINNLIVIPIELNGVELSFLLDTGVNKPLLFNITNTDSLQINNVETFFLRGLGDGKSIKALKSKNNFFKVGNAININQDIYVVFDKEINFTPKLGVPVHGIIGYDIFKNFVIEINYKSKYLRLHKSESYAYKKCKKCETFNLSFYNNKPYMNAKVDIGDKEIPVKLLIDTGSSDALWLFEDDSLGITTNNNNYFRDFLGRGLSGNVYGKRSKINAFMLKKFALEDVNASFPDSSAIHYARKFDERNGSISAEILRRFNVVFDYKKAKMTLKKNRNFKDKFYYNRSGIVVEQAGFRMVKERTKERKTSNYGRSNDDSFVISNIESFRMSLKPAYTIVNIRKGSPAERAGLLPKDIIVAINGKDTSTLKLQNVISHFRDDVGKTIKLIVKRNDNIMKFVFKLEDVFKKKETP